MATSEAEEVNSITSTSSSCELANKDQVLYLLQKEWDKVVQAANKKFADKEFEEAQKLYNDVLCDSLVWVKVNNGIEQKRKIHLWTQAGYIIDRILEAEGLRKTAILEKSIDWGEIVGLSHAKTIFEDILIRPQVMPEDYGKGRRIPATGILLFGPPGTGKSFIAKTAATSTNRHFIELTLSNLMSPFLGVSEQLVKQYFEEARLKKPSIIFIDEMETLTSKRKENSSEGSARVKSELLTQMQLENEGVLLIGATNIPEGMDQAFRRRFQEKIYISNPKQNERKILLRNNIAGMEHTMSEKNFEEIASAMDLFSAYDIVLLAQKAISFSLDRKVKSGLVQAAVVSMDDMKQARAVVKPSITRRELFAHERFAKSLRQEGVMQVETKEKSVKEKKKKSTDENFLLRLGRNVLNPGKMN